MLDWKKIDVKFDEYIMRKYLMMQLVCVITYTFNILTSNANANLRIFWGCFSRFAAESLHVLPTYEYVRIRIQKKTYFEFFWMKTYLFLFSKFR